MASNTYVTPPYTVPTAQGTPEYNKSNAVQTYLPEPSGFESYTGLEARYYGNPRANSGYGIWFRQTGGTIGYLVSGTKPDALKRAEEKRRKKPRYIGSFFA